jgi:hypothetical protein
MNIIYKKSLKGVEEVALGSKGLQLRLRAYLILVDGSKSVAEIQYLNPRLPEVEMVLAALLDEGYVEVSGQHVASPSNNAPTSPPTIPQTAPQMSAPNEFPPATNNSLDNSKFIQARESMTREIMTLLGKDAEMVVTKIQRCDNAIDLFAMMMGLKKIITMYANTAKAEEFSNKFSYISTL